MSDRAPELAPDLQFDLDYFRYQHLPEKLQEVSKPFHDLAHDLAGRRLPKTSQLEVAMQKLLEAKDAAVRAAI